VTHHGIKPARRQYVTGCFAGPLTFVFIGIELNKEYYEIAKARIDWDQA